MSQEEDLVFAEVPAYRRFISKGEGSGYSVSILTETSFYTPEQLEGHDYFVCWIDEEWQHHTISINPAAN